MYSIYNGSEVASSSSSVNDVDRYSIIRMLLDSIYSLLPIFIRYGKFRHSYRGLFFSKFAYTRHDVPWFVGWMDLGGFTTLSILSFASCLIYFHLPLFVYSFSFVCSFFFPSSLTYFLLSALSTPQYRP